MDIEIGRTTSSIKDVASSIPGVNQATLKLPSFPTKPIATPNKDEMSSKEQIAILNDKIGDLSFRLEESLNQIEIANEDLYRTEKYLTLLKELRESQENVNYLQDENELLRSKVYLASINSEKGEVLRLIEENKALKAEKEAAWMASPEYLKSLRNSLEQETSVRKAAEAELRRIKSVTNTIETDLRFDLARAEKEINSLKELLEAKKIAKAEIPSMAPRNNVYTANDLPKNLFNTK